MQPGTLIQITNEGVRLYCPTCVTRSPNDGHYFSTFFGSVTPDNQIIIMRKNNRTTTITANEFSIACDCGYQVYYKNGAITTSQTETYALLDRG